MNYLEEFSQIFEPALANEFMEHALIRSFEDEDILIDIGQTITHVAIILEGSMKIVREDATDGEHVLYFIERGMICTMSVTCCYNHESSEIRAIAEGDGQLAMIPLRKMEEWMSKYTTWRNFILKSYNLRFKEMLAAVDSLAFMNLEERMLRYLKDKAKVNNSLFVEITHQEIATDLNTSRVAISRLLKKAEKEEKIKMNRKFIECLMKE